MTDDKDENSRKGHVRNKMNYFKTASYSSNQDSVMKKAISFFLSQAITLFGSQIVALAIVWYITLETSSGF